MPVSKSRHLVYLTAVLRTMIQLILSSELKKWSDIEPKKKVSSQNISAVCKLFIPLGTAMTDGQCMHMSFHCYVFHSLG